jgi:hypothetical protein
MVLSWLDQDAIAEKLHPNYKKDLANWEAADLRKEVVDVNLLQDAGHIPENLWNPREREVAAAIRNYVETISAAPVLTALEPAGAALGSPDVTMVVAGTGFVQGHSTIYFNGHSEPTTFVDDTHVSTGIKPSIFSVAEALPVLVRNNGAESNVLDWTFTPEVAKRKAAGEAVEEPHHKEPVHKEPVHEEPHKRQR